MAEQQHERVAINWFQVAGSALAAVSSAVLLSTVGVAGTIIGAALGSVVVTAGGSIYSHYLEISRHRVAAAQSVARARKTRSRSARLDPQQQKRADDELHQAEEQLADAEDETVKPSWREPLAGLRWRRIAAAAAAIFVAAMLIIVTFEMVTGRAVSTYTGGTDGNPRTLHPGPGWEVFDGYAGQVADSESDADARRRPGPRRRPRPRRRRQPTPSTPAPSTASTSPPRWPEPRPPAPTTTPTSPTSSTVPTPTQTPKGTPSG